MKQIQLLKLSALALLLLAGCSARVDNLGYMQNADWKDGITVGTTTKQEVQEKFGSPSTQSSFGVETWYYISGRKETVGMFKPEIEEQNAVRIAFDTSGVVTSVNMFDKDSGQDITLVKRTTPTEGHSMGFVEQILGNVGRFNAPGGDSPIAPGRRPSSSPGGF